MSRTILIQRRTVFFNNEKKKEDDEVKINKNELIEVLKLLKGAERMLQSKIDKA